MSGIGAAGTGPPRRACHPREGHLLPLMVVATPGQFSGSHDFRDVVTGTLQGKLYGKGPQLACLKGRAHEGQTNWALSWSEALTFHAITPTMAAAINPSSAGAA